LAAIGFFAQESSIPKVPPQMRHVHHGHQKSHFEAAWRRNPDAARLRALGRKKFTPQPLLRHLRGRTSGVPDLRRVPGRQSLAVAFSIPDVAAGRFAIPPYWPVSQQGLPPWSTMVVSAKTVNG
jgi:hypothetical protein